MKREDFPAIYVAADRLAEKYQRVYLLTVVGQGTILILLATAGLLAPGRAVFLFVALLFLILVFLYLFLMVVRPDQIWYGARAVAESVKTMVWRYVCSAPPFSEGRATADQLIIERLREVLRANDLVTKRLDVAGPGGVVTDAMIEIRSWPLTKRISFYKDQRVNNQLDWYASKSRKARSEGFWSYCILIAVCLGGMGLVVGQTFTEDPSGGVASLGLVTTACAFLMTWIQAKRYLELSAAYSVSSHEIAFLVPGLQGVRSQREFGEFVTEAENAFSREHTQWAARRDT